MPFLLGQLETINNHIIQSNDTNTNLYEKLEIKVVSKASPQYGHLHDLQGKAPYATSLLPGSITVEASVVMPLVILAWMSLMQIMTLMNAQVRVQCALNNQALKAAGYTYFTNYVESQFIDGIDVEEILVVENIARNGLTELIIKQMVVKELGDDFFEAGYVSGGQDGLDVVITPWVDRNQMDVILTYSLTTRFNIFGIRDIHIVARARLKEWTGETKLTYDDEESTEENEKTIVYVTPAGTVYHVDRTCTYLKIKLTQIQLSQVGQARNDSGSKYRVCEACGKSASEETTVYISKYGERYHFNKECNKIYHNIIEKSMDEVENMRPCSKCTAN